MQAEITRKDEQKYLRFKILENPIFAEELSVAEIITNIENGSLHTKKSNQSLDFSCEVLFFFFRKS